MSVAVRWSGLAVIGLLGLLVLSSCGPRTLSALGNPGDLCTEETACTDGTTCRATDDGYRCSGSSEEGRSKALETPTRGNGVDYDAEEGPAPSVEEDASEDERQAEEAAMDFDEPEGDEPPSKEYVPPSRRRRGGR